MKAKILHFLLNEFMENKTRDFDRYMIARGCHVTTRSFIRHFTELMKEDLMEETRTGGQSGKTKFYKLKANDATEALVKFIRALSV